MSDRPAGDPLLPMRVVTARTGLTADVLRAWERRYQAVSPGRTTGGQRLYSEDDVARLGLLRRATAAGHSIAEIARLDMPSLERLVEDGGGAGSAAHGTVDAVAPIVAAAIAATERLDAASLEVTLRRGALALGGSALVDQVVSRFMRQVGERWHEGAISPAHEHLASAVVRRVLAWLSEEYATGPRAPRVVVATPAGELHEFGAMLVAAAAAEEGWRVVYLGANLPAASIADAATQSRARAVALSVVYAAGPLTLTAVEDTRRLLGPGTSLLVGGAAAERSEERLGQAGIRVLPDMPALRRALRALRLAAQPEAAAVGD